MNIRVFSGVVYVIITLTLTILIVGLNGKVYSQMFAPPYQLPQSKQVSGKYVNPGFGLEIVFPEGFNGYETSSVGYTDIELTSGVAGVPSTAIISLIMTDYGSSIQALQGNVTNAFNINPNGQNDMACSPTTGCVKIGGMNAQVFSSESSTGGYFIKSKSYSVVLGPYKTFQITYQGASQQGYDSNLGKFEDALKTIKFTK